MKKARERIADREETSQELPGFLEDERGAVFLEFIIVLFAWMFILFGVLQIGLIAIASYFVNYANFMALRTAAVQYEYVEYGWISTRDFERQCREQALKALTPLEPKRWKDAARGRSPHHHADFQRRFRFVYEGAPKNNPRHILGRVEYDYYMIIPFANYVIAAFDTRPPVSSTNERRVMHNFRSVRSNTYPTIRIRSHNSVSATNDFPAMHQMLIQRRWRYN